MSWQNRNWRKMLNRYPKVYHVWLTSRNWNMLPNVSSLWAMSVDCRGKNNTHTNNHNPCPCTTIRELFCDIIAILRFLRRLLLVLWVLTYTLSVGVSSRIGHTGGNQNTQGGIVKKGVFTRHHHHHEIIVSWFDYSINQQIRCVDKFQMHYRPHSRLCQVAAWIQMSNHFDALCHTRCLPRLTRSEVFYRQPWEPFSWVDILIRNVGFEWAIYVSRVAGEASFWNPEGPRFLLQNVYEHFPRYKVITKAADFHPYRLQESSICVRCAVSFSRVLLLWHFVRRNRVLL